MHSCDDKTIIGFDGVPIGFRYPFQSGFDASNHYVLAHLAMVPLSPVTPVRGLDVASTRYASNGVLGQIPRPALPHPY